MFRRTLRILLALLMLLNAVASPFAMAGMLHTGSDAAVNDTERTQASGHCEHQGAAKDAAPQSPPESPLVPGDCCGSAQCQCDSITAQAMILALPNISAGQQNPAPPEQPLDSAPLGLHTLPFRPPA